MKRCQMDLWSARLVLTHHHLHQHHQLPSATLHGDRVSSSFLLVVFFFLWGLPFALVQLGLELLSSYFPLSRYFVRVALLSNSLASRLAASNAISLEQKSDSPFNPSFDTLGLCWAMALPDQPPPPDHLENHLIWVDLTKMVPLGLKQNVPWVHSA